MFSVMVYVITIEIHTVYHHRDGCCKWVSSMTIQSVWCTSTVLSSEAHSNSPQSQRRLQPLSRYLSFSRLRLHSQGWNIQKNFYLFANTDAETQSVSLQSALAFCHASRAEIFHRADEWMLLCQIRFTFEILYNWSELELDEGLKLWLSLNHNFIWEQWPCYSNQYFFFFFFNLQGQYTNSSL